MNPEKQLYLNLKLPPARATQEEAAWYLGFEPHDIPVLVRNKLLKALGNPPLNGLKHFAMVELEGLRADARWLARATDAVHHHWRNKNKTRKPSTIHDELSLAKN
jgi:hypothetical protein